MSSDQPERTSAWQAYRKFRIVGGIASIPVVGLLLLYLLAGGGLTRPTNHNGTPGKAGDNPLEAARASLLKETDLATCRAAVSQVNAYLSAGAKEAPPGLGAEQRDRIQSLLNPSPEELGEIEGTTYTQLDAHHLDRCFLFRDAARSLEAEVGGSAARGVHLTPLDQACVGFDWVVRQVRLEDGIFPVVPPQFALRRGWGTALDRALVFLALLEQLGDGAEGRPRLHGCLVFLPQKSGGPRLWACGVAAGDDKALYLFDPRLGLALPGPKGEGVATLAAVCADPAVLGQLTVDPNHSYDVTAEEARAAQVRLGCPLSALAPRTRYLQEKLLAPAVRVNLAADAAELADKLTAAAGATNEKPVVAWKPGCGLLRDFLPKQEGGADPGEPIALNRIRGFGDPRDPTLYPLPRRYVFEIELAPWYALPEDFRDPEKFPFNVGLGQTVRARFAQPFRDSVLEPRRARDLMLRGRHSQAFKELSDEREQLRLSLETLHEALKDPGLKKRVDDWVEQALSAYAEQLRTRGNPVAAEQADRRVEAVWKQSRDVYVLLQGAIARPRLAEVAYLLALGKQDRAEQIQARLDLAARTEGATPNRADVERAAKEWREALNWWKKYADEPDDARGHEAARRLRGRALEALGEREAAAKLWEEDVPGKGHKLEKVACLYLAARAKKK